MQVAGKQPTHFRRYDRDVRFLDRVDQARARSSPAAALVARCSRTILFIGMPAAPLYLI